MVSVETLPAALEQKHLFRVRLMSDAAFLPVGRLSAVSEENSEEPPGVGEQ